MERENSTSCSLLTIPLEIRNQIYELILGGSVIVFMSTPGSPLRNCLCPSKGQKFHFLQYTEGDGLWWCRCGSHSRELATHKRLPLLLACQQIYVESVKILWAQNTIHLQAAIFPKFQILSHLRDALPSHSFRAIRSLEISCLHGLYHREQTLDNEWFGYWNGIWDNVKLMEGLLDLQVWLKLDQDVTREQEARLFKPLMGLELRDFKLEVTWPASKGSNALLLGAPFSLVRNNAPIPGKPEFGTEIVNGGPL